jgi:cytochrome c oxidase cbb3-type subunit 1
MLQGQAAILRESPSLHFVVLGIVSYLLIVLLNLIYAIPAWNGIFHFTHYFHGTVVLTLLGLVTPVLFAAIYYIAPRMFGFSWICATSFRYQFWFSVVALALMTLSTTLGGLIEGLALDDAGVSFVNVLSFTAPWRWLDLIAWILLLFSYFSFARFFAAMLFRATHPEEKQAALSFYSTASVS